jgi:hypothetical protein
MTVVISVFRYKNLMIREVVTTQKLGSYTSGGASIVPPCSYYRW